MSNKSWLYTDTGSQPFYGLVALLVTCLSFWCVPVAYIVVWMLVGIWRLSFLVRSKPPRSMRGTEAIVWFTALACSFFFFASNRIEIFIPYVVVLGVIVIVSAKMPGSQIRFQSGQHAADVLWTPTLFVVGFWISLLAQ